MSTFLFRGYTEDGHKVYGSKAFPSKDMAEKFIEQKGYTGYQIYESKTQYSATGYKIVSPKDLSIFSRQMSVMFFSNITILEGVLLLSEQAENKNLKLALEEIHSHMENGLTFADALSMYEHIFGSYMINMVLIGESSGTLDGIFMRLASYFDKESGIRKKLRTAVTYPAILTVLMTGIILILIVKILPMFNDILSSMGGQMPALTAILLSLANFINDYLVFIVVIIAAIVFGLLYYIKTEKGMLWWAKQRMKIPGVSYVTSRVVTSRFSRSMAILLKSGVQLLNALEDILPLLDNAYIEQKFRKVIEDVKMGTQLSDALKEVGVFPPLFLKMIVIGQSTGHLDDMLDRSASIFDEEVYDAIEKITVMIEPILIIILSIIVSIILLSVMLPMISIMNAIG